MKVSEYLSKIRVRFKTTARPLLLMAALLLTLPHRPSLAQGTTTDWQNLPLHFPEPRETVGFVDSIPHFRLRHPSSTSKQMNAFVFSDGLKLFFFFLNLFKIKNMDGINSGGSTSEPSSRVTMVAIAVACLMLFFVVFFILIIIFKA